jgi:glycosyltransferase involved in cell wall biosynthesis
MKNLHNRLASLSDSTAVFSQFGHPYYIVAPAFSDRSAGIRLLHQLCSLLNKVGYEAHLVTEEISGHLWAPSLSAHQKKAHYLAGKKPIVVYPEVIRGAPLGLGLTVRYALYFPGVYGQGDKTFPDGELVFKHRDLLYPTGQELHLPIIDLDLFTYPTDVSERSLTLVYYNRYTGPLQDHGDDVVEISSKKPVPHRDTAALYKKAKVMYAYEGAANTIEARLCGCPVILVPNEQKLPAFDENQKYYGVSGLGWGLEPDALRHATETVGRYQAEYLSSISRWKDQLIAFIDVTQAAAEALPIETAWPQAVVDGLPGIFSDSVELAKRADRLKWARVHIQYKQWRERSSLREIDGQIYAEHLAQGGIAGLAVVIAHRADHEDDLADTLDSIQSNLIAPKSVHLISDQPVPDGWMQDGGITWTNAKQLEHVLPAEVTWVLVIEAGCILEPHALAEWGWYAQRASSNVLGIYSDEDVRQDARSSRDEDQQFAWPYFKPDANLELLQCMNYLGTVTAWRRETWLEAGCPINPADIYGLGLRLMHGFGRSSLEHIDSVLFHAPIDSSSDRESAEFAAAEAALRLVDPEARLCPLPQWGSWLAHYPEPANARVSLVVPTGPQTGFLRSLLQGVIHEGVDGIGEILLVCHQDHVEEVRDATRDLNLPEVRILTYDNIDYNHSAALNLGFSQASCEFVLVCDDDIEPLHKDWLSQLLALLDRPGIGCVAPRLLAARGNDGQVNGGPLILGIQNLAAPYNGEERWTGETGVYGRLQFTQNVSAVAGHCFATRRSLWVDVGAFDESDFPLWTSVLDWCLRAGQKGWQHIWTPLSGVLHHGGKTVEFLRRDPRRALGLADQALTECNSMHVRWGGVLSRDPAYNRHLSLMTPFDIESDIVVDWQPVRKDRPRALAVTLNSGGGQYRVVEPFAALQAAGIAQTVVVLPLARGLTRVLQPLELLRAAPDCLVLQHSVDDGQLGAIDRFRAVAPGIPIIQMVDDLFGETSEKHPNRAFLNREGHQRLTQALLKSQRMIVSTEPLRLHYARYITDVRRVPNSLASQWDGLVKTAKPRQRLRVGWVGAGQHQDDLEMIAAVVATLAGEVDWIFMGMCPEKLQPYIHEFHHYVSIAEYPKIMASLDLDIAIAPLVDNLFNRCKSNLRLLEYGAMGWPVVCSDVYPYRTDDPPVVRVANDTLAWVQAIRTLYEPQVRQQLGQSLAKWVDERFRLIQWVEEWGKALFEDIA